MTRVPVTHPHDRSRTGCTRRGWPARSNGEREPSRRQFDHRPDAGSRQAPAETPDDRPARSGAPRLVLIGSSHLTLLTSRVAVRPSPAYRPAPAVSTPRSSEPVQGHAADDKRLRWIEPWHPLSLRLNNSWPLTQVPHPGVTGKCRTEGTIREGPPARASPSWRAFVRSRWVNHEVSHDEGAPGRRRAESNRRTGLCRPLPKPLGHAARGAR